MWTSASTVNRYSQSWKAATVLAAVLATLASGHPVASAQSAPAAAPASETRIGGDVRAAAGDKVALNEPRARLELLGERDLKTLYRACSRHAMDRRLGSGEIAFCSTAYEVLMKEHFAGDFDAFLAWSRGGGD